jgi:hypothetical protein
VKDQAGAMLQTHLPRREGMSIPILMSRNKFKNMVLKVKAERYPMMKINDKAMNFLRREILPNAHSLVDVEEVLDLSLATLQAANIHKLTRHFQAARRA